MLTISQIILRLILPIIFGFLIFWFKKGKVFPLKIYLFFPIFGSLLSIFFLKVFFRYYSKIDPLILPASLILGIFIFAGLKGKETKEISDLIILLLFLIFIGLLVGFGFYEVAIFTTLLILILEFFDPYFPLWLKK